MNKIPSLNETIIRKPPPHSIDFVGTGTFQVSQFDLLQKRSVEMVKSLESTLSARGLHHRNKEHFVKDVKNASAVISQALLEGVRDPKSSSQSSYHLKSQYFQRALGNERLGRIEDAIIDYSKCVSIDPKCSSSYFNRGGLYMALGRIDLACEDYEKCVELAPTNITYLQNRAIVYRRKGMFTEATQDIFMCRQLKNREQQQNNMKTFQRALSVQITEEDPVIVYLSRSYLDREDHISELKYVIEFLKGVKFFHGIANDHAVMRKLSQRVKLVSYDKDQVIFKEGDYGTNFFIIVDGEVQVFRLSAKSEKNEVVHKTVLVKLFRGQTFGETALNKADHLRTAGAECLQRTRMLSLELEDYNHILHTYRSALRNDVKLMLASCAVFNTWNNEDIEKLADHAVIQSFAPGSNIITCREPVSRLYIVKRGIVKLVKAIPVPQVNNIKADEFTTLESAFGGEPGLWVLKKNWKDSLEELEAAVSADGNTMDFVVGVLGSGQLFGELSILSPSTPSPTTAIAYTSVELYGFTSDFLISAGAKFNANTMNVLNESLNLYNPPEDKIAHYYRSKFTWEKRKQRILSTLHPEKTKHSNKPKS